MAAFAPSTSRCKASAIESCEKNAGKIFFCLTKENQSALFSSESYLFFREVRGKYKEKQRGVEAMEEKYRNITQACDNKKFCTCVDHTCGFNPANSALGCTPCVAKCLAASEIPSCFFRRQEPDMDRKQDYTFEGFANFTLKHKKQG